MNTQASIDAGEFSELTKGFIDAVSDAARQQREDAVKAAAGAFESSHSRVKAAYGAYLTGTGKALARATSGAGVHPCLLAAISIQLYQASQVAAVWGLCQDRAAGSAAKPAETK